MVAPVRATDTVRKRQAVRPYHHVQNHTCRVTLLQPARQVDVLDWSIPLAFGLIALGAPAQWNRSGISAGGS
jgi:hypothetical protein